MKLAYNVTGTYGIVGHVSTSVKYYQGRRYMVFLRAAKRIAITPGGDPRLFLSAWLTRSVYVRPYKEDLEYAFVSRAHRSSFRVWSEDA